LNALVQWERTELRRVESSYLGERERGVSLRRRRRRKE